MNDMTDDKWILCDPATGLEAFYVASAHRSEGNAHTPVGTILLLQEIFGVNTAIRATAIWLSELGYNVIAPDLFGKVERRTDLGYGAEDRKKGFSLMQQMDRAQALKDCEKAVEWARLQGDANGKIASVGFCIGGLLALQFAAVNPCEAAISFYGVQASENIQAIESIRCPVQYHVGENDTHIPAPSVDVLTQSFARMPAAQLFRYPDAGHGFFNPMRGDVFAPEAAGLAAKRMLQLLKDTLT